MSPRLLVLLLARQTARRCIPPLPLSLALCCCLQQRHTHHRRLSPPLPLNLRLCCRSYPLLQRGPLVQRRSCCLQLVVCIPTIRRPLWSPLVARKQRRSTRSMRHRPSWRPTHRPSICCSAPMASRAQRMPYRPRSARKCPRALCHRQRRLSPSLAPVRVHRVSPLKSTASTTNRPRCIWRPNRTLRALCAASPTSPTALSASGSGGAPKSPWCTTPSTPSTCAT